MTAPSAHQLEIKEGRYEACANMAQDVWRIAPRCGGCPDHRVIRMRCVNLPSCGGHDRGARDEEGDSERRPSIRVESSDVCADAISDRALPRHGGVEGAVRRGRLLQWHRV